MAESKEYSLSEEDHIKAIRSISRKTGKGASTSAISKKLGIKSSSVTSMVKRLAVKGLVEHRPYYGATLTESGSLLATQLVRRHRLWETFLVNELKFKWDQVHVLAEQLEHISSDELVDRLDDYMGNPKNDPHGDPIPNKDGVIADVPASMLLAEVKEGERVLIQSLNDTSDPFLQFLDGLGFKIGTQLMVMRRFELNNTLEINTHFRNGITLVGDVAEKINVRVL